MASLGSLGETWGGLGAIWSAKFHATVGKRSCDACDACESGSCGPLKEKKFQDLGGRIDNSKISENRKSEVIDPMALHFVPEGARWRIFASEPD